MNKIVSPHDKFFKLSLQEKQVAIDFFKHHLPKKIQEQIDFNTLYLESESFIDEKEQAHFSDILYSVQIIGKPAYLFILAEHQSKPERLMPFRVFKYMFLTWERYIKNNAAKELPIIYPLIFYHGQERPYPYSCDLLDCFSNKALAKEILQSPVQLIDVTQIPDEELKEHGTAGLFELLQKHIFERDMQAFLKWVIKEGLFKWLRKNSNGEYFTHVIKYVINQGQMQDIKEFFTELSEAMPEEEENTMPTIAEYFRQKGVEQGMQQGVEQGVQQGMQLGRAEAIDECETKIVNNLYRSLKDEQKVAELADLTLERVQKILNERSDH